MAGRGRAHQILLMEGLPGLRLSSKGKRPVSSWCAMTPADQMSEAGSTADLSTSGAMYLHQGSQAYFSVATFSVARTANEWDPASIAEYQQHCAHSQMNSGAQ